MVDSVSNNNNSQSNYTISASITQNTTTGAIGTSSTNRSQNQPVTYEKPMSWGSVVAFTFKLPVAIVALVAMFALWGAARIVTFPFRGSNSALKNRSISHQDSAGIMRTAFQSNRLVKSKNFPAPNLYSTQSKYQQGVTKGEKIEKFVTEQLHTQGINQEVRVNSMRSKSHLTPGLCQGMVTDMAARMIRNKANDQGPFETRLRHTAQKYEDGARSKAVANHLLYASLPSNYVKSVTLDYVTRLERSGEITYEQANQLILLHNATTSPVNQIKGPRADVAKQWERGALLAQDPKVQTFNQLQTNLSTILTPKGVDEGKFNQLIGDNKELLSLLHHFRLIQKSLGNPETYKAPFRPVPTKFAWEDRIISWHPDVDSKMQAVRTRLKQQHQLINEDQKVNIVADARNMEIHGLEDLLGVAGNRSDEDYLLNNLGKLPNGYFEMVLDSGGPHSHTALLIRNNNDFYIWDPSEGYGLMKMNQAKGGLEVTKANIQAYLNSYRIKTAGNHQIQLRQFVPKTPVAVP